MYRIKLVSTGEEATVFAHAGVHEWHDYVIVLSFLHSRKFQETLFYGYQFLLIFNAIFTSHMYSETPVYLHWSSP